MFPLEALALGTEPFGKKVLCSSYMSALYPELLQSFFEHCRGDGPWACLFLLLTRFLNGPRRKRLGDTSNPARESEKAINRVSIQVPLDLIIGPKC